MPSKSRSYLGAAIVALAVCSFVQAGPMGTAFTYQGRLTDNGAPANGQYDFSFRLYGGEATSIVLASPTVLENVQVTNGLFTVKLDFGDQFNGNERWLSVWVRPGASTGSYTVLAPRQELTPTAYALAARSVALPMFASGSSDRGLIEPGLFRIWQAGNENAIMATAEAGGDALRGHSVGTGTGGAGVHGSSDHFRAGFFEITNASNPHIALYAETVGSGHAIQGYNRGTGRGVGGYNNGTAGEAGFFQIGNAANASPALYCKTIGSGPALKCDGRAIVDVLEITGADVAEKFPVTSEVEPGTVVMIDRENPGKLCRSSGAYNKRVAGVVSGANGLPAGTILGNLPGHEAAPPIALSGRVWTFCDASERAIEPGDLITTADRAGYAMAVIDGSRAAGATIGKAMTALAKGETGMVLVLVNLQ